jgi:excisionase family DNA binding protein
MRTIATNEDELLTASEFAKRMNMKESTVRAWLLSRKICKIKIGRRLVRIPVREVDRIIREGLIPAREKR